MAMIETPAVCYRMGMIRLAPILLLAFGLVLALASLTQAGPLPSRASPPADLCLGDTGTDMAALAAPSSPERDSAVCWKKLGSGLLLMPCPPDPSLIAAPDMPKPPEPDYPCEHEVFVRVSDVVPVLLLPPPRG